jgi:hypothetical protein
MAEEVKVSKLDQLKTAITDLVNCDVNQLRDSTKKLEFVDNFKTIIKADDSGVYSWLEKVLPFMKDEANKLGITMDAKAEFTPESEVEEPTDVTEEEPTPEATEEAPAEEATPAETATESTHLTRGNFLVEAANNYID